MKLKDSKIYELIERILTEFKKTENIDSTVKKLNNILKPTEYTNVSISDEHYDKQHIECLFMPSNYDRLDLLLNKAKLLGWFPSYYRISFFDFKKKDFRFNYEELKRKLQSSIDAFTIFFEKVYDEKMVGFDILYHITPIERIERIKKQGLSPKSNSKRSYHPERIYFSYDEDELREIKDQLFKSEVNKERLSGEYVVIEVNINKLPKQIKLYSDPNFSDGVYTYDSIPPQYLKFTKIFHYKTKTIPFNKHSKDYRYKPQNIYDESYNLAKSILLQNDINYLLEAIIHQKVKSSNIFSVGYDSMKKILQVKFRGNGKNGTGGGVYNYYDVEPRVYKAILKAKSKGKYFWRNIRDEYQFLRI